MTEAAESWLSAKEAFLNNEDLGVRNKDYYYYEIMPPSIAPLFITSIDNLK